MIVSVIRNANIQVVKSFRRSVAIRIDADGRVIVRAPHLMPDFLIRRFIADHSDWIEKQRKVIAKRPKPQKQQFVHGEQFLFMGNFLTLDIGPYKTIEVRGTRLLYPEFMKFRIEKELVDWYKKRAIGSIQKLVEEHAGIMGVSYSGIYFSDTKSKWGSCSHDDTLQFNWRLIMAPLLVIRYVVIHELTHTVHKHHSRTFWSHLARYNPSYRQQVKWLKENGGQLSW